MAIVRTSGYQLKDPGDNESFQMVVGDLQRIAQRETQDIAELGSRVSALEDAPAPAAGDLLAANNLSELTATAATARANLQIGIGLQYQYGGAGISFAISTATAFTATSSSYADLTGWDTATGVFTAPTDGVYTISAGVTGNHQATAVSQHTALRISEYPVIENRMIDATTFSSAFQISISMTVKLSAGGTLTPKVFSSAFTARTYSQSYVFIHRIA